MNAEAQKHLDAISVALQSEAYQARTSLIALTEIIRNQETEAAIRGRELETAYKTVKIYAQAAGYEGPDSMDGFAKHLKELVERNKTQAEYFDKLCAITGSPSHDLDELVKDVRALKSTKEMIETYRDDWRAQSRAKDAENKRLTEQLVEAQQQSQPQPLPCHTLQTHQPDPVEEQAHERARHRKVVDELVHDLQAARAETASLRAERDRYAKIIDRL